MRVHGPELTNLPSSRGARPRPESSKPGENESRGFPRDLRLGTVVQILCEVRLVRVLTCSAALVMFLVPDIPAPAWGALGQSATTVEDDRAKLNGQHQRRGGTGYSIDTITVAGMEINEYVSSDGVVFAVVWKGTGAPDLKLLLGEYFEEYQEEVAAARSRTPRVREPFKMKSDRLVVERAGHSRSLWGRAYLPSQLPPGIRPEDIQ